MPPLLHFKGKDTKLKKVYDPFGFVCTSRAVKSSAEDGHLTLRCLVPRCGGALGVSLHLR